MNKSDLMSIPSDQTIWASVFVRDASHEQDDCRLFHQLTVAHFHEAPPMRGFLFVQNALIPVTTKVRGYLYVFWCLVMRALSEMSCQKCKKPHGIRRASFLVSLLCSLLLRAYRNCTAYISRKQVIYKIISDYAAINGISFSSSRLRA